MKGGQPRAAVPHGTFAEVSSSKFQSSVSTLKENLLWVRTFHNVEELRQSLLEFKRIYHENRSSQGHGYQTPAQARREQSQALPPAA